MAVNPLRYRGYHFDSETGFYFLQSRYYDPKIGRFINADDFASTGQGILGHNMFAYCLNNPIGNVDTEGHIPSGITNPNSMGRNSGCSLHPLADKDQAKMRSNTNENAVIQAEDYAYYSGALVVRHNNDFLTSWSLFGVIFLNTDVKSSETLKHEYGHFLQERQYGSIKYIAAVFYPSATFNGLSRLFPSLSHNYYNMPWEYDADIRGDVNRSHASWSGIISDIYFVVQRILP